MTILAILTLTAHLGWIAFVIFGAFWTRDRPLWGTLHILALLWGVVVEVSPWPCPLTLVENYFEIKAGVTPYQGSFLVHYLDAIVYPNLPDRVITASGVAVCSINLGIYAWRLRTCLQQRSSRSDH